MSYNKRQVFDDNLEAIRTYYDITSKEREITKEDIEKISKYKGFGGLKVILLNTNDITNWSNEDLQLKTKVEELNELLKKIYGESSEKVIKELKTSVLTAFYTPEPIVKTIVEEIKRATGGEIGNILEPSAGMGIFMKEIKNSGIKSKVDAYEKDILTSSLLKCIAGEGTKVYAGGFETTDSKDESYDLVISNIPFGNYNVFDVDFVRSKNPIKRESCRKIHNYFFLKAIDKVRDGGIVAFITTRGTSDTEENESIRREMMKQCRLVSAIRLPNNLFNESGTSVGSDLIILQKDSEKKRNDEIEKRFVIVEDIKGKKNNGYLREKYNIIFDKGEIGKDMYGKECFNFYVDTIENANKQLKQFLERDMRNRFNYSLYQSKKNIENKNNDLYKGTLFDIRNTFIPENIDEIKPHYAEGVYIIQNGKVGVIKYDKEKEQYLFHPENGSMSESLKMEQYIKVREAYLELIKNEERDKIEYVGLRQKLNEEYNLFVKRYGIINDSKNINIISRDLLFRDVIGLEYYDKESKQWEKADVFLKPVSFKKEGKVESEIDALTASLNKYGKVNLNYMSVLLDKDWKEIVNKLENKIILNPVTNEYELRDVYLSGDIYKKIREIKGMYKNEETMPKEVLSTIRELEKVRPKEIPIEDIKISLGERWIKEEVYEKFANELFGLPDGTVRIFYDKGNDDYKVDESENSWGKYLIKRNWEINDKWAVRGEKRGYNGLSLLEHAIMNSCPTINKKTEDGRIVPDKEKMEDIARKIELMRKIFEEWVISDKNPYKDELQKEYNEKYNNYRPTVWDGSFLKFSDIKYGEKIKELYPSQKDAIWMLLCNQGGIVDHVVGGGKTVIMCVAAHEMKRLGISNKPMIIAMKNNIVDVVKRYKELYPNDKILYTGKDDFSKNNRERMLNSIRNNDYDCIIITHDNFKMIPQSERIEKKYLERELLDIEANFNCAKERGASKRVIKDMLKAIENNKSRILEIETRLKEQKDNVIDFEKMGIDMLFVDESHIFKNLKFTTKNSQTGGIGNPRGSDRAINLKMAAMTIQEKRGRDLGLVFLSGTTISNSLSELFLIEKYMRPRELEEKNLYNFDAWAEMYAIKTRELEVNVTGQLEVKERFRYYKKVPELAAKYASITHYQTAEMIGLDRPKLDEKFIMLEPTEDQKEFIQRLIRFVKNDDPGEINKFYDDRQMKGKMLIASDLANKMSIDMRLVDEKYDDDPGQKIWKAAEIIKKELDESNSYRGTVLVFCDISTPKKDQWNVYQDLKEKLIDKGVNENEIRYIHEFETDEKKNEIFDQVNKGQVRVLIGSTGKMGVGLNVQERVVAMVHLDIPWKPSDLEQRIGRGQRTGNWAAKEFRGNTVKNYIIGMKMDAFRLNTVQNKQMFINQIKNSSITQRVIDDGVYDEKTGISRGEYVAMLIGDKDLMERAKLERVLIDLEQNRNSYIREIGKMKDEIKALEKQRENIKQIVEKGIEDVGVLNKNIERNEKGEMKNIIKLNSEAINVKNEKEIGKIVLERIKNMPSNGEYEELGEMAGLKVVVKKERIITSEGSKNDIKVGIKGNQIYVYRKGMMPENPERINLYLQKATENVIEIYQRNENALKEIENKIQKVSENVNKKWEKEELYQSIKEKFNEVDKRIKEKIEKGIVENESKVVEKEPALGYNNTEIK